MPRITLKPRKQPLQDRSQQTVTTILEAASRILEREGLAGFTTNAVAGRAGVSIGSLYQYFPNKDSLVVALIHVEQQALIDALGSKIAAIGDAPLEDGIEQLIATALASHARKPRMTAALDHEETRLPIGPILTFYRQQLDQVVAEFLRMHLRDCSDDEIMTAARSTRIIAQCVIDDYAIGRPADFGLARSEATKAVLGYLAKCAP